MHRFDICLALLAIASLTGCAGAPQQRFYTLGNQPASMAVVPVSAASTAALARLGSFTGVVLLASVTIPEMVDRPQLVLRTGANQVTVLDNERWAESLKTGVARVLAAELSAQLGGATVVGRAERSSRDVAATVQVDVAIGRLDASLQDGMRLDATWRVRPVSTDIAARAGDELSGTVGIREPTGATGIDAAVAAHDRALARLAATIAQDVRRAVATARPAR